MTSIAKTPVSDRDPDGTVTERVVLFTGWIAAGHLGCSFYSLAAMSPAWSRANPKSLGSSGWLGLTDYFNAAAIREITRGEA